MSLNGRNIYTYGFYTLRAFKRYHEHQNWSPNEEVMHIASHEEFQPATVVIRAKVG